MSTYLPEPVTVGRVTSDRVRYVYFEDGTEVIVLGLYADDVAFRAADYDAVISDLRAKLERACDLLVEATTIERPDAWLARSKALIAELQ